MSFSMRAIATGIPVGLCEAVVGILVHVSMSGIEHVVVVKDVFMNVDDAAALRIK
jgi:hypothetical protein